MKSFIRFTRSAIVLSVITIGNTAGGAAGAERSPTSAQDQRDYARYQLQLAEQTARLDREDAQLGSGAPATTGAASAPAPAAGSCGLFQPGATTASAESCRACHGMHSSHPVDLDYSLAEYRSRDSLRPAAEVVKRGVFLPEGKVRCLTCHDPVSKWKHHLALPPGSTVRPAVDPRRPETYRAKRELVGNDVSPTPLCKACHTQGD